MSDLSATPITEIEQRLIGNPDVDHIPDDYTDEEVRFVLDSIIDFLEELKLSGEQLRHGGQLLRDVEELRSKL